MPIPPPFFTIDIFLGIFFTIDRIITHIYYDIWQYIQTIFFYNFNFYSKLPRSISFYEINYRMAPWSYIHAEYIYLRYTWLCPCLMLVRKVCIVIVFYVLVWASNQDIISLKFISCNVRCKGCKCEVSPILCSMFKAWEFPLWHVLFSLFLYYI